MEKPVTNTEVATAIAKSNKNKKATTNADVVATVTEVTVNNTVVETFDAVEYSTQVDAMTIAEATEAKNAINNEIKELNAKREDLRVKRAAADEEYKTALAAIEHLKTKSTTLLTDIQNLNSGYAPLHAKKNLLVNKLDMENIRIATQKLQEKQAKKTAAAQPKTELVEA